MANHFTEIPDSFWSLFRSKNRQIYLAGIQTDENGNLCLEKTVNDVEGYTAFLDSFIGGALE